MSNIIFTGKIFDSVTGLQFPGRIKITIYSDSSCKNRLGETEALNGSYRIVIKPGFSEILRQRKIVTVCARYQDDERGIDERKTLHLEHESTTLARIYLASMINEL